ncbi:MAG: hypothetical protein PHV28_17455 [Kiritimatiellae bacterium]|nr:hypothetical protein [Kiritimatiellia bacterium]
MNRHINISTLCVLIAAALSAASAGLAGSPGSVLAFNEDDSHFMGVVRTEAQYRAYIDEVCRGPVTHFFMCPNAMRCNIPATRFEPWWLALDEPEVSPSSKARAMKALHEAGVNPYRVWSARCREKGVSPWFSMRMNDVHDVHRPTYGGLSRFWRDHPEYRRVPGSAGRNWSDAAFDYARQEVRDFHLSFVKDLADGYDVDGIELDWMRFPSHLKPGREREDARFITEFMRETRKLADAAARRLGHKVRVGARVPTDIDGALAIGLDVVAWAKDGSVDMIVPCNFFVTPDYALPYADWKVRIGAVNPDVMILPGLDSGVVKEGGRGIRQNLTAAEYRGFADAMHAEGAPGVYLFNLFVIPKTNGVWDALLTQGLAPQAVAARSRAYPSTYRENSVPGQRGFQVPVPVDVKRAVTFRAGAPAPEGATLATRFAFNGLVPEALKETIRFNGAAPLAVSDESNAVWLPDKTQSACSSRCTFPVSAFRPGENRVEIGPAENRALVLRACETFIDVHE